MKRAVKKAVRKPAISLNELRHLRAHLLDLACQRFSYAAPPEEIVKVATAFEAFVTRK